MRFRVSMHNHLSLHPLAAAPGRRVAAGVVILGIAVLAACGCGGGSGVEFVEGIVLLDGVPLDDAIVAFSPVQRGQGLPSVGKTGPDGKFTLTVVPQGGRRKGTGTAKGDYLVSVSKQLVEYFPPPPGAVPDAMGIIKPPPPRSPTSRRPGMAISRPRGSRSRSSPAKTSRSSSCLPSDRTRNSGRERFLAIFLRVPQKPPAAAGG